jgi:hypothetical protein
MRATTTEEGVMAHSKRMAKVKRPKQPQDATLRNVRASTARLAALETRFESLRGEVEDRLEEMNRIAGDRILALEGQVKGLLDAAVAGRAAGDQADAGPQPF